MKIKSGIISFVVSFVFWIGLQGNFETVTLIVGGVVSAVIALFFSSDTHFEEFRFAPKVVVAFVVWVVTFTVELVKSNIDVMARVVTPKVRINPAIVEVKTKLQSKWGRLALANSITLTPGTLTVDIIDEFMYIHWIDATSTDIDGATKKIVDKFEKHLEVIFG